jgi:NAD-dependent deacetylase
MENVVDPLLVEKAAQWIARSHSLVIFTGAGVSRESGIPTFREAGTGFWEQYDPQQLATVEGFLENPKLVWEWYAYRRKSVAEVQPNPGHYALARLEKILPEAVVVTQNIDDLHRRAGSSRVIELHGNIKRVKCFRGDEIYDDWRDEDYKGEIPPRCRKCNSFLRPDVVWFGEPLPERELEEAFHRAENCDLMLVVGTSGLVQPAASLPFAARRKGARIVEVNPQSTDISSSADILLQARSGEIMPEVVNKVEEFKGLRK